MPHIPQKPIRPPRDEEQNDNRAMNNLASAIKALTAWLQANMGSATKRDLDAAKAEILKAIGGPVTPGIEAAIGRTQAALDRLDAQIDDK